jgi:hypothetical protein
MENRKNKILPLTFIAILTLTAGCGITITRNHYYAYPDQSVKKSNKDEAQINYPVDTLTNSKNGQN